MEVREIKISEILGSLCRMRLERDYEREELLASIKECGVMDPIKVKKVKGGYMNFTGNRRIDCSKELGLKTIRAEIWEGISDIVEDEYEKDPAVRKLWKKSVVIRRSRAGDKITIEFNGPIDLFNKYTILSAPLKGAKKRFRTVVGRNTKIP